MYQPAGMATEDEDFGYLARRLEPDNYEVTKWGLSQQPVAVYTVRKVRDGWMCSSPGCKRSAKTCKHASIVKDWLKTNPRHDEMPTRMIELK